MLRGVLFIGVLLLASPLPPAGLARDDAAEAASGPHRPKMVHIPPGTHVGRTPPKGWSHLVVKSLPRLASGDLGTLPSSAARTATLLPHGHPGRRGAATSGSGLVRAPENRCRPERPGSPRKRCRGRAGTGCGGGCRAGIDGSDRPSRRGRSTGAGRAGGRHAHLRPVPWPRRDGRRGGASRRRGVLCDARRSGTRRVEDIRVGARRDGAGLARGKGCDRLASEPCVRLSPRRQGEAPLRHRPRVLVVRHDGAATGPTPGHLRSERADSLPRPVGGRSTRGAWSGRFVRPFRHATTSASRLRMLLPELTPETADLILGDRGELRPQDRGALEPRLGLDEGGVDLHEQGPLRRLDPVDPGVADSPP